MRIKCISCSSLTRLVTKCAGISPHQVDVEFLKIGLHNQPSGLRVELQRRINSTGNNFDAITLAYGLCGQAIAGLSAHNIPLIIPRAHDCITLSLGSRERYQKYFDENPGTYWLSPDFMEQSDSASISGGMGSGGFLDPESYRQEYLLKYGAENADYLVQTLADWKKHYTRAIFLDPGNVAAPETPEKARMLAVVNNWEFLQVNTERKLICNLLSGDWDDNYLIVQPGQHVENTASDEIIRASSNQTG